MTRSVSLTALQFSLLGAMLVGCGPDEKVTMDTPADAGVTRCTTDDECKSTAATATCNDGACDNSGWSCIGQADDRAAATMATATLKVGVFDMLTMQKSTSQATARACPIPTSSADITCPTPLANVTATHDLASGIITVTGLPQNTPFRLMVDPVTAGAFVPIDFYSERTARDVTETEAPLYTFPQALITTVAGSFIPPIQLIANTGMFVGVYHDCKGKWAANASLSFSSADGQAGAKPFYLTGSYSPEPTLTATTSSGTVVAINVPVNRAVPLTSKVSGVALPDVSIYPFPGRAVFLHAYPRTYAR